MTISENVADVLTNVANTETQTGHKTTVIGVTKYVDADQARALVEAGITHIAENV